MHDSPDTRESLLLRVKNSSDHEAWHEFAAIYRPVVYRLARRRGMQDADAQDLAQQVLTAVSQAIERWQPDGNGGRFRHWLGRVAHNAILNALSRGPRDRGGGGTTLLALLHEHPQVDETSVDAIQLEYRRESFRRAARYVREEVNPTTWLAFWLTTVEDRAVEEVAAVLGISIGSVYAARSRVMRRLRIKVREFED